MRRWMETTQGSVLPVFLRR